MAAHALLAAAHELHGEKPLVQRNLGALEYRAHGDGERVAAVAAEVEARPMRLTLEEAVALHPGRLPPYRKGEPFEARVRITGGAAPYSGLELTGTGAALLKGELSTFVLGCVSQYTKPCVAVIAGRSNRRDLSLEFFSALVPVYRPADTSFAFVLLELFRDSVSTLNIR